MALAELAVLVEPVEWEADSVLASEVALVALAVPVVLVEKVSTIDRFYLLLYINDNSSNNKMSVYQRSQN